MLFWKNNFTHVRRRDGRVVPLDETRITNAIGRALQVAGEGDSKQDAEKVSKKI